MTIDPGIPVLGFALLGAAAGLVRAHRRKAVNLFIAYALAVSFGTGLTQRELWPFSSWPLVASLVPERVTHPRTVALDAAGREHDIDWRAWSPFAFQELVAWQDKTFLRLAPDERDRVAAYQLGLVEAARRRFAAGDDGTAFSRFLGPFSAPFFLGHPDRWSPRERVPPAPFVGLRLYKETWNVEERHADPGKVRRVLAYEYRAP